MSYRLSLRGVEDLQGDARALADFEKELERVKEPRVGFFFIFSEPVEIFTQVS